MEWIIKISILNSFNCRYLYLMYLLMFALLFGYTPELYSAKVTIETPRGGFTTNRIQNISGTITGYNKERATLIVNGLPQFIAVHNGRFSVKILISPGSNLIEVKADGAYDSISFYADVPKKDVKIVLTWDTPTDVDLWVIDPKGEKCYYSHSSTSSGGNLDMDNTSGFGPETFTMEKALKGEYTVQVQYYGSGNSPVTRVQVFVVLFEGTSEERREKYEFVMTKEHAVYTISNFNI
ncbi:MAG: DUF2135 domain-containing protein [Spirochaetia bacterium]|nr:DUF2135 domain-containing protein [Spirochaetia bacterium]